MTVWAVSRERWVRMALALALAGGVLAGLQGCAHQAVDAQADAGSAAPDANETTDMRRRAHIRLELAASYLQRGQTKVAMQEVDQALATDPTFADAYHLRGLIHMDAGDLARAEADLKRAQDMKPADPDVMHNYGWLLCQRQQYAQADQLFARALQVPTYASRSKTLMAQGVCQQRAGQLEQAEKTLLLAYEIDAGNPALGFNLASVMFARGEIERAQFYIRRVNNGEYSNAETLWLGVKIERALKDSVSMRQLGEQLRKRYPESKQARAYEAGSFNE